MMDVLIHVVDTMSGCLSTTSLWAGEQAVTSTWVFLMQNHCEALQCVVYHKVNNKFRNFVSSTCNYYLINNNSRLLLCFF